MPPSKSMLAPVMKEESSDARNRAPLAISAAVPNRPMGICTRRRCFFSSVSRNFMSSSVCRGPGQRLLNRMFSRACTTANSRVSARTAPLLAVYATWGVAAPMCATKDAVFTTDPPPALRMAGTAYLQPFSTPLTLTARVLSITSALVWTASLSDDIMMPALLNKMCKAPNSCSAVAIIASASVSDATSAQTATASPPDLRISSTVA
mmetsp:Transcript_21660/g.41347  ORF Transcript_21660/g.41347 Transcript_21660/m.41347 type:complete len:207 (+) Transcript_21660:586-1206(+)